MNTEWRGPLGAADDAGTVSRIVRIARHTGPAAAAAAVALTVWAAVPHAAWLPWPAGLSPADTWQADPSWPAGTLADLQITLGAHLWSQDAVAAAIGVAAAFAAATALGLAVALRTAGLGVVLAPMTALVAAAAPLLAWQAGSPLGAAPATLVSTLLLCHQVRLRAGTRAPALGTIASTRAIAAVLVVLIAVAGIAGRWLDAPPMSGTLRLLRGDLGLIGLVLLVTALGRPSAALVPRERVWLGAAALWLVTMPMAATVRAALLLPWCWWLAGAGLAQVIAWRGRRATRWATVGVALWIALHAARVPWGYQRQAAALARSWADGLAARVDAALPLVREDSPRGRLAATVASTQANLRTAPAAEGAGTASVARPTAVPSGPRVIAVADAREAVRAGRRPLVVSAPHEHALRWGGVALDVLEEPVGLPLERLLDALPRDTIVAAALSRDAASRLRATQWQALGRIGLRVVDAGASRSHAIVGVTGARVAALEHADSGAVRLDVQPGDPLGRTGVRSPIDVRVDADATRVRITLRDRPLLDEPGIALLFFSTRGDVLGWRAGATADHLDGPPLGLGPFVRRIGMEYLHCVDVTPGRQTDIEPLTPLGALGLSWAGAGEIAIQLTRPVNGADSPVRRAGGPDDEALPMLMQVANGQRDVTVRAGAPTTTGLYLRGATDRASASSTTPARICAAWPLSHTINPGVAPVEMPVSPRFEAHYGAGWHDMERRAGGGYFRWMAGPRATLLLALRRAAAFRLVLDAQGVAAPRPGDEVQLLVNGHEVGRRALHPTRGLYAWEVPAAVVRPGINTVTVATTQSLRPADIAAGGDPRTLGLAVHGWRLEPEGIAAEPESTP